MATCELFFNRCLPFWSHHISIFVFSTDFQEAFQLFDQKGDGRVQVSQIGDILRALGQNPTESDVKKLTHNHRPGTF